MHARTARRRHVRHERLEGVVLDDGSRSSATCSRSRRLEPARPPLEPGAAGGCAGTTASARPCPTASFAASRCVGKAYRRRPARRAAVRARPTATRTALVRRPRARRRRSPTSAARSAPGSARSSTSSASRRSAPAPTRARPANVNAIRVAARAARRPSRRARDDDLPPAVRPGLVRARSPAATAGALFDPVRVTPIHPWHVAHGAVFENVGQWHRPRYFPRGRRVDGGGRAPRVRGRARRASAMMDASTLGKIDVQGPDAVELLNRLYTNAFDSLAVGTCRYARDVQGRTGWCSTTAS